MMGIPTSSAIIRFLLVGMTGVVISQVIIPTFFPALNGTGLSWAWTIGCSVGMWFISGRWINRVRREGELRQKYR
jgi:putative flippase GtrA